MVNRTIPSEIWLALHQPPCGPAAQLQRKGPTGKRKGPFPTQLGHLGHRPPNRLHLIGAWPQWVLEHSHLMVRAGSKPHTLRQAGHRASTAQR